MTVLRNPCPDVGLTLVSAFFDLGEFVKGEERRTVEDYLSWSEAFRHVFNRLVFYTDSQKFAQHIGSLRSGMIPDLTHIIVVNRQVKR